MKCKVLPILSRKICFILKFQYYRTTKFRHKTLIINTITPKIALNNPMRIAQTGAILIMIGKKST